MLDKINAEKYCYEFIDAFKMEFNVEDIKQNKEAKKLRNKINSINRRIMKGDSVIKKVLMNW